MNEIILGDCLEVMQKIQSNSVDAIITDPPFALAGGLSNGMHGSYDTQFFKHWFTDVCKQMIRVIKPEGCMFIWCDWRTISIIDESLSLASEDYDGWYVSQVLIHNREMIGMGKPFRNQTDWICFIRGRKTDYKERIPINQPNILSKYFYYGKHEFHPSEKSIDVSKMLVGWATDENQIILDPFAGSGTVCIASKTMNRNYIGIEKEEKYYQICKLRLENTDQIKQVSAGLESFQ